MINAVSFQKAPFASVYVEYVCPCMNFCSQIVKKAQSHAILLMQRVQNNGFVLDLIRQIAKIRDWIQSFFFATPISENTPYPAILFPLKEQEAKAIAEMLPLLTQGIAKIIASKSLISGLGEEISHLHPLQFLGEVCASKDLKVHLRTICSYRRGGYLQQKVWSEFSEQLFSKLKRCAEREQLNSYCKVFAQKVGGKVQVIRSCCEQRDWEGLLTIC